VAFRTMVNDRTDVVQTFLDCLDTSGLDQDLFAWDDRDDTSLVHIAAEYTGQLGLYHQDWNQYMLEIDPQTWLRIRRMTRIVDISRWPSSPIAFFQNIVVPLDITSGYFLSAFSYNHSSFAFMARVVDENYEERSTPADFESEEFWTTQNLEDWLSTHSEILCRAAWQTSSSILKRVRAMDLILYTSSQVSSFACVK
jgi:hypothetical protein